ncbi:MAG: DUF2461 domain-containing protein [Anaerolineaceae bacterium]|nr:DUF2461 domain-containing protein [Anaerolineaceae bacterium]
MPDEFGGFPAASQQFLAELAANNRREWFQEQRERYQRELLAPAQDFCVALGKRLQAISPGIRYDPRANGQGSLLRINRDTRFSSDKSLYKTVVGMLFWEGPGKKMAHPAFGFELSAAGARMMAGMFAFDKAMLAAYRLAVADERRGAELERAAAALRAAGNYEIQGQRTVRVPAGYAADHPRAEWLKYKNLYASLPPIPTERITSPELVDHCYALCEGAAPLFRWLVSIQAGALN